jgi:transcriptional regulator with XRE-family HTH domain
MNLPRINTIKTGQNIKRLREECGISVKELQEIFGFSSCQAIYKWQKGTVIPTIDNLVALSSLFNVPIEIIIATEV